MYTGFLKKSIRERGRAVYVDEQNISIVIDKIGERGCGGTNRTVSVMHCLLIYGWMPP